MSKGKEAQIHERKFVPSGSMILHHGDDGSCAYLIQSGRVLVFTEHEGKQIDLAKLDAGQIFGEMALIFDGPRTASVKALEDTNLVLITREALKQKLDRSDPTIKALMNMLSQRVLSANNSLMNKNSSFDDLNDTVRIIYQNVHKTLKRNHQRTFENTVLTKLDEF